jgi:2-polyprenyl-6-hydroxyphenyl methylase/3-demethylubiquinone-9 3-methyltransferase
MWKLVVLVAAVGVWLAAHVGSGRTNDLSIYDEADWWNPNTSFSILHRMNAVRVPFFLRNLPVNGSVVDIGCGGGLVTEPIGLSGLFGSVTGFDINQKSLEKARNHLPSSSIVEYKLGSIYNVPLNDSSVEGVIVSDVFEHLEDLPGALSEIFRVLKPGGVLVFDTIARTWWSWLSTYFVAQEVLGLVEPGAHDWSMFVNPEELEILLKNAGFEADTKEWIGICAKLSPVHAYEKRSIFHLIESFYEDKTDLRSSYMGSALKPLS